MCPPKDTVFAMFWCKNGYRLCSFGLELGMVYEGTLRVYECICHYFELQVNKKERVILGDENSKQIFRNLFVGVLI